MTRWLRGRSITFRVTAAFLCAMAILLALTGAFIYQRMQFALNRSIRDVPSANVREIDARRRHRDEALHELLSQLAVAFCGTLLISGFVGHRVARAALAPVERMRRRAGAESIDLSFRLPVPDTQDELARLAETLNELLARVQAGVAREHRVVADASHELRTPLSLLLLRVDLALSRERSPAELHEAMISIQHDTRRLVRLANDLLLLARADEGRLPLRQQRCALLPLAEESRGRFAAMTGDRRIRLDIDPALKVQADRDGLGQTLDNLIDNALRHGNGTVTVAARARDGTIAIEVADEGPGFVDGFAEHAFDRFTTSDQVRTGASTGLGLAIVAAIAKAHGGRVHASNRRPAGAAVTLELPAPHAGADCRAALGAETGWSGARSASNCA